MDETQGLLYFAHHIHVILNPDYIGAGLFQNL